MVDDPFNFEYKIKPRYFYNPICNNRNLFGVTKMPDISIVDSNGDTEAVELQHMGDGLYLMQQFPEGSILAQHVIVSLDQLRKVWAEIAGVWGTEPI